MKFYVSVCTLEKYDKAIQPSLDRMSKRYERYCEQFAEKLCCSIEEVSPHVYIVINTMLNYMLFGKASFTAPQLDVVYKALDEILKKRERQKEKGA